MFEKGLPILCNHKGYKYIFVGTNLFLEDVSMNFYEMHVFRNKIRTCLSKDKA